MDTHGLSPMMADLVHKKYVNDFNKWASDVFLNTSYADRTDYEWFVKKTNAALDKYRNGTPIIVGLCGNMGTGKDSAIDFCMHHGIRCARIAFADPIREIGKIFGFTMKQMTDRTLKEQNDDFWHFSPRYFMQKVGTEMFREQLRDDVWINLLCRRVIDLRKPFEVQVGFPKSEIGTYRVVFVTDVRFPNEAQAIRDLGGIIVKIKRDGFNKTGADLHPSERFISQIRADLDIENTASNAEEWSWKFTRALAMHFVKEAYYGN